VPRKPSARLSRRPGLQVGRGEPKPGQPVSELLPERPTLASLREVAAGCKACDLYKRGTQTVFGEGPRRAEIMMVGEQPGDAEDVAGHPFVGPAGRLLDRALEDAGIDRGLVYVTNVVKHFKWEPRGKRRIHAKPNAAEIGACRPWLETEIALVKPRVLVCLGATAAQALLGRRTRCRASAASSFRPRSRPSSPRPCTRLPSFAPRTTRRVTRRCAGSWQT
jgi:uracil-DNA glycosylase family protein